MKMVLLSMYFYCLLSMLKMYAKLLQNLWLCTAWTKSSTDCGTISILRNTLSCDRCMGGTVQSAISKVNELKKNNINKSFHLYSLHSSTNMTLL